jgi:multicomponent Na+:H+ antiporter subunit D
MSGAVEVAQVASSGGLTQHLPVLQVVVPLLAAPICVIVKERRTARALAILASWVCLYVSLALLGQVLDGGAVSYLLGGWAAPYGIEYRVDAVNAYVLVIVSLIAAVVLPFGKAEAGLDLDEGRIHLFYTAFLLCLTGLLGMAATGDAFNIFVFLEISSLASYTLIATGKGRRALRAAYSYLVMGTIGGTFYLIGIGLLYQVTGTLNIADLQVRLEPVLGSREVVVAFAFLVVGLGIKLALFPLHQWLPNAYTWAPSKVSAFLAATATKVGVYVLLRILFGVFGVAFVFGHLELHQLLVPLSLAAMLIGSLAAIAQTNIKRLLAYSSIAQIGYMTLGIAMANTSGLTGGVVHLFNHAMMKGGLFLVVACVVAQTGSARIDDMAGLGKQMPVTMAALVVGGLSLIGVPSTVGFVSKWYLVQGALERGWNWGALLILLSSLLAVVYVWRVLEVVYFRQRPAGAPDVSEVGYAMRIPTWILTGACVVFGLHTGLTVGVAETAAHVLLGGAG